MRAGIEAFVWCALLVGVWDVTLSGTTLPDVLAAVGSAAIAGVAAVVARRTVGGSWRVNPHWARWIPVLVASVVINTGRVFALTLRHLRRREVAGQLRLVPVAAGNSAEGEAYFAAAMLTITSTPGSFVYDTRAAENAISIHRIVDGAPDLEATVGR